MSKYMISIVEESKGYQTETMPLNLDTIRNHASGVCENMNLRENCTLLLTRTALDEMLTHIGWRDLQTPVNRVEQGGLLAGLHCENPVTKQHFCVALHAYPLLHVRSNPNFLDAGADSWAECFAAMDRDNASLGLGMNTVGWYHTHPNGLPTFMSGTDRYTQRTVFNGETSYALVLNPHTGSWKAFRGPEAVDAACYMLDTDELTLLCGEAEKAAPGLERDALLAEIRRLVAEEVARQTAQQAGARKQPGGKRHKRRKRKGKYHRRRR